MAPSFRLAAFNGGRAHNAIPREAFATVVVAADTEDGLLSALRAEVDEIQSEYRPADPGMTFVAETSETPDAVWDDAATQTVLRLITALPHGVEAMSYEIPDLVETSSNVATVKQNGTSLTVGVSTRSSIDSALEALRRRVRAMGFLAGASVEEDIPYPGWKPDLDSHLLSVVKVVHRAGVRHRAGGEGDSCWARVRHHRQESAWHRHDFVRGRSSNSLTRPTSAYTSGRSIASTVC